MSQQQDSSTKKTALITGASSGIGLELSKLFAKDGYDLVLVSRNKQKLARAANTLRRGFGARAWIIAKDLSKNRAAEEIYAQLRGKRARIDVLVNNAGFGAYGFFSETDLKSQIGMIQVNITSLTTLTRLILKDMMRNGEGMILNVSSTAAFQPGPLMAVYYATKAYILSFSQALSNEVKGSGVSVSVLCPGPTETGFQAAAGIEQIRLVHGPIPGMMNAAQVAQLGYERLMKGKTVSIPGVMNKVGVLANRFMPRALSTQVVRILHAGPEG